MADNPDNKPTVAGGDDEWAKEIAQLKYEVGRLKEAISGRADDLIGGVEGLYDTAAEQASKATQALRSQAQSVTGVVRENPGTVSSAFLVGGIIGFLFGLALSSSEPVPRRWYERH